MSTIVDLRSDTVTRPTPGMRQAGVAYGHDFTIIGPGRHCQFLGAAATLNGQRVVAVDSEVLR